MGLPLGAGSKSHLKRREERDEKRRGLEVRSGHCDAWPLVRRSRSCLNGTRDQTRPALQTRDKVNFCLVLPYPVLFYSIPFIGGQRA
jgi:hypothetical protein